MKLLIIFILFSFSAKSQVYLGFQAGSFSDKPQAGLVLGAKGDAINFQITETVPLSANNKYPVVVSDATVGFGTKFQVYGGYGYGREWLPCYGVGYYKSTWYARAGVSQNQFTVSVGCFKLFE